MIIRCVLIYLPGYTIDEGKRSVLHPSGRSYCKSIISPYKVYGVCLFIYAIIDNSFKVFDIADELGVNEKSEF